MNVMRSAPVHFELAFGLGPHRPRKQRQEGMQSPRHSATFDGGSGQRDASPKRLARATSQQGRQEETLRLRALPLLLLQPQQAHEGLLGDVHVAHPLHAAFAFPLLLQELALAGDVAPVTLSEHVLAQGFNGFSGDDAATDSGL